MPIYEYVCKLCGHRFDALRTIKDSDKEIACKNCDSKTPKRTISTFFAVSGGRSITSSGGCGNCNGGICGSCHH